MVKDRLLAFNLGDSWLPSSTEPATYYSGIITYVGDPQPETLEQTIIELSPTGGFIAGKLYSVVVNGNRYDVTTNATNTIDSIGEFLSNYISSMDPTVNAFFNSSSNILTIRPIVLVILIFCLNWSSFSNDCSCCTKR